MEKEILLNNGVKIPTPGFGTFLTPDGATCVEAVKAAIAAGYTHIDTAAIYKNEKSVGEGIKESGITSWTSLHEPTSKHTRLCVLPLKMS